MPKKKISKVVLIRRAKSRLDKLWSLCVRGRDGKCLLCGTKEHLNAHHTVVRKARSLLTRWEVTNGLSICEPEHRHGIHQYADLDLLKKYMEVVRTHISEEEQLRLCSLAKCGLKLSLEDLLAKEKELQKYLADLNKE